MEEPTSAVEERIKGSMRFGANMPMLSRQGFIDLGAKEYLRDLEVGYMYLGRVIERYGVWSELGSMPRSVLPEGGRGINGEDEQREEVEYKEKAAMRAVDEG
jgi:hypothetical protein